MKKLLVFFLLIFSTIAITAKEKCTRIVHCYDIQIQFPNPDKRFYYASKGYIEQLQLNSVAENDFFKVGIQPMRILAEPWEHPAYFGPDSPNEYVIWGKMTSIGDNRFRIELFMVAPKTRLVIAKGSTVFEGAEEAQFGGSVAALMLGSTERGSKPLIDVITDFEKKERAKDPEKYKPICPEMSMKDMKNPVILKPGEVRKFMIEVKDADGEPIKGLEIELSGYKGKMHQTTIKTDYKGIGYIVHTAPDEEQEYEILGISNYETPGEKHQQLLLYPSPRILVKKPVKELSGLLRISYSNTSVTCGTREDPEQKSIERSMLSTTVYLKIIPERIEYLQQKMENFNRAISEFSYFSIASGNNVNFLTGEPVQIHESMDFSMYNKHEGKLRLDEKETSEVSSNGCDLTVEITTLSYQGADGLPLPAIARSYCLVVKMGSNARALFNSSKYPTTGKRKRQQRNEYGEMESVDAEVSPKQSVGIRFDYSKSLSSADKFIAPMKIPDVEALERYLLNPNGVYTLSLKGSAFNNSGSPLNDEKIGITLTLTPFK
ncbi:MAG: hypothetical protein VB022_03265 [Rikenellaceae bacterium]|nr:hypothetical protein [Rikenellaceae bacterium]